MTEEEVSAFAKHTAGKRHAYLMEPIRIASWNHRKPATG